MADVYLPGRFGILLSRRQTGFCDLCGVPFYSDRDMRGHLGSIAHRETAEAMVLAEKQRKARIPFLYAEDDPEVEAHLKQVGKRMLAEGRMVVKPNERAGFS